MLLRTGLPAAYACSLTDATGLACGRAALPADLPQSSTRRCESDWCPRITIAKRVVLPPPPGVQHGRSVEGARRRTPASLRPCRRPRVTLLILQDRRARGATHAHVQVSICLEPASASAKADQRGRSGTALRPGSRAARRDSDAATAPGGAACCSGSQTLLKGRRGARRVRSARHSSPSRSRAARRCEDDVSPSACDAFATRAGGSQRRELRGAHAANAHRGAHHIACDRHERGEDRERPHRPLRALRPHSSDQGLGLARSSARGG